MAKRKDDLKPKQQHKTKMKEAGGKTRKSFLSFREYLNEMLQKQFIREQLDRHNGNITAAALGAGMSRQRFYRLMRKHEISSGEKGGGS